MKLSRTNLIGRLLLLSGGTALMLIFVLASAFWSAYGQHPGVSDWEELKRRTWVHTRASFLNSLALRNPPERTDLPVLHLYLADGALEEMVRAARTGDPAKNHDPGGDKPWFKGFLKDESEVTQGAKVALRGLGERHHNVTKPSLRVKIKKEEIELGRRYVELTRPEDTLAVSNWLSEEIAREFGVMTHIDEHVALYLNNRFAGLYTRGYRAGEKLALQQDRLPGTFFKGDREDMGIDLWTSLDFWRVSGEDTPNAREAFEYLLKLRAEPPSQSKFELVQKALDADAVARWSAVQIGIGSAHTDFFHNQVYFHDSVRGLLEPVVWDPNGFGLNLPPDAPVDLFANPVADIFSDFPRWVHRRNLYLYELQQTTLSPANLRQRLEMKFKEIDPWLMADPGLGVIVHDNNWFWMKPVPVTDVDEAKAELYRWLDARHSFLMDYLNDSRFYLEPLEKNRSRVTVFGTAAVEARWPGGQRTLYPGLSKERFKVPGLSDFKRTMRPAPLVYDLPVSQEELEFRNAVTGAPVSPEAQEPQALETRSFLPEPEKRVERPADMRLGPGQVVLRENLLLKKGQALSIAPGTEILLAPGVSLFSQGPVLAKGTEKKPIRFAPLDDEPWGAIALFGEECGQSEFEHVFVSGGSVSRYNYLAFKGMFNAYNCPSVVLKHCVFGPNQVGDDAVNFAECEVDIADSTWENARSDALDLDQCQGRVTNCRFVSSGNDGLNISTSLLEVHGCLFEKNGDKGMSIGEASQANLIDCRLLSNTKGVQVKDRSQAELTRCTFSENGLTVEANRKKWLFGKGGQVRLYNCQFLTKPSFVLDARSSIELDGVAVSPQ